MRFYLLLLPLLWVACSPRVTDPTPTTDTPTEVTTTVADAVTPFGTPALLRPGQTMRAREAPTAAFTFVAVTRDSRCPTGTNCIRAGEALVTVQVGDAVQTITIGEGKQANARFSVPGGFAEVTKLDPYPTANSGRTEPDAYRLKARLLQASNQ